MERLWKLDTQQYTPRPSPGLSCLPSDVCFLLMSLVNCVSVQCELTIEPNYATLYVVAPNGLNLTCTGEDTTEGTVDVVWYKGTQKAADAGFNVVTRMSYVPGDRSHQTELVSIQKTSTSSADSEEYRCKLTGTPDRTITVTVLNGKNIVFALLCFLAIEYFLTGNRFHWVFQLLFG